VSNPPNGAALARLLSAKDAYAAS